MEERGAREERQKELASPAPRATPTRPRQRLAGFVTDRRREKLETAKDWKIKDEAVYCTNYDRKCCEFD